MEGDERDDESDERIDSVLCSRMLQTLVDEHFLIRTRNASFLRA